MSHRRNGRADEAQRHWLCCPQLNSVDRLQKALNYAELDFVYRCLSNLFSVLLALETHKQVALAPQWPELCFMLLQQLLDQIRSLDILDKYVM